MEFKKFMAYSCMMALIISVFTGCGSESASKDTETSTKTVQVTEIDGDQVKAVVGELAGHGGQSREQNGEARQKPDGTPPADETQSGQGEDGKSGDEQQKPDGTPPTDGTQSGRGEDGKSGDGQQKPDGTPPADGQKPDGNGGPGGGFTASDDTVTFTITDDTEIVMEQGQNTKAAAESDIKENMILEVTLDENSQATKIVIKGGMGDHDKNGSSDTSNEESGKS